MPAIQHIGAAMVRGQRQAAAVDPLLVRHRLFWAVKTRHLIRQQRNYIPQYFQGLLIKLVAAHLLLVVEATI